MTIIEQVIRVLVILTGIILFISGYHFTKDNIRIATGFGMISYILLFAIAVLTLFN